MREHLWEVANYPDPESSGAVLAACEKWQVWPTEAMAGNGATELLHLAARTSGLKLAVIPAPAYVDYERICKMENIAVQTMALDPASGFEPDFDVLAGLLAEPALVFLGQPNNPTGNCFQAAKLRELAKARPESLFIVDESFADFVPGLDRLVKDRPANVITIVSLTKFLAMPGLRFGLAFAHPESILKMKAAMPGWSVNVMAQAVALRGIRDQRFAEDTLEQVAELRQSLTQGLMSVPGIRVHPSSANFLLCQTTRVGQSAKPLADELITRKIAIRLCDNFTGLDQTYFRVAVKSEEHNRALVEAMREMAGLGTSSPAAKAAAKTPALMIQGDASNSGKSVLAAAFCRIFFQDGLAVAPFKAQNMSLNSFVTPDGREIGRAQATQAAACRLAPDARMNPVLLKPGSDTGSQVIVMGRPVGNMQVRQYVDYKPTAFDAVKKAYDSLAAQSEVMVLEGAGSPAEVNLKHHDIVNMAMADYAGARVLIAGDIDRGGVFASLVGTMELLTRSERSMVAGYLINKFRGDPTLLDPALTFMSDRTGRPVLGIIPFVPDLNLPEEDSVNFKAPGGAYPENPGADLDVALVDLPRISNFTDMDPLAAEPDVNLRVVKNPDELFTPDLLIIPGSKNTIADMAHLEESGLAGAIRSLPQRTTILGICAGFQILGQYIGDPLDIESEVGCVDGLGLLPIETTLEQEKTLTRTTAVHPQSGLSLTGYEIHHGRTTPLIPMIRPFVQDQSGQPLGYTLKTGRVMGTYLHGLFDSDDFRRHYLDQLREKKGLPRIEKTQAPYELESALDRLADIVRENVDMAAVYRMLGY